MFLLQSMSEFSSLCVLSRWMAGWQAPLTKADLGRLVHHGHFDGAAVRQGEGQVLGVGELELLLPHAPEGHCVDQGHLQAVSPPQSFDLGLA